MNDTQEDYLKAIYEIQLHSPDKPVGTSILAKKLGVSLPSVTGMFKKLAATRLVKYHRHRGVHLTPKGEVMALQIIRRHRLIESFLVEVLGFTWDEVHFEADLLEHVMSEKLESRITALLDDPQFDPHGDPIPGADKSTSKLQKGIPLTHLEVGQSALIKRVSDEDPELLRYLAQLDLTPRERVEVVERGPFDGPVHVRVTATGDTHPLSRFVTDQIFVTFESQDPSGNGTHA